MGSVDSNCKNVEINLLKVLQNTPEFNWYFVAQLKQGKKIHVGKLKLNWNFEINNKLSKL